MRPSGYRFAREIRKYGGWLLDRLLYTTEALLGTTNIHEDFSNIDIKRKKIFIYSVYVTDGAPSDWYELSQIALTEQYHSIIVNTGSAELSCRDENVSVLNRRNIGRDISSYGLALSLVDISKIDHLVLVNDSMDWDPSFIRSILKKEDLDKNTIYALTHSRQRNHHLQTYLLIFNSSIIRAAQEIQLIPSFRFKRNIVNMGERYLSQKWIKSGIKLKPIFESDYLMRKSLQGSSLTDREKIQLLKLTKSGEELNPSIHFWEGLYIETRSIKKSVFNSNPAKLRKCPKNRKEAERSIVGISLGNF